MNCVVVAAERKLRRDLREEMLAGWVSPEIRLVGVDVGHRDFRVILHSGLAAELTPPVLDRMIHLGLWSRHDRTVNSAGPVGLTIIN